MLAFVVTVPAGEAELAADALWALGVSAVEERDPGAGTQDHMVELWTSLGDDRDVVTRAAEGFPARWRWRVVTLDPAAADTWRQHAMPTWVADDLVVYPAWKPFVARQGVIAVSIDPGPTFGAGDHPTTVLCLRALRRSVFSGATVVDIGCGSGVLAVAACMMGAARADAIDLAPGAVVVAEANAAANGVQGAVWASTTPVAALEGPYDLVVANILAPAIVGMATDLGRLTGPSGIAVVSGVLAARRSAVVDALASAGALTMVDEEELDGWAAVTLRH